MSETKILRSYVVVLALLALAVILFATGCDESDAPAVHGVISVSPSPLPPFEVRFRDVSPTPVEVP